MTALSRFPLPLVIATLCACDGGSPGAPLTDAEADDLCRRYCDHEEACGGSDDQCFAGCRFLLAPYLRGDTFRAQYECYIGLHCGDDPGVCTAFANAQPLDFHIALGDLCRERLDCFTEAACANLTADLRNFNTAVVAAFSACFDFSACVEIEACFDDVAAGIPLLGL